MKLLFGFEGRIIILAGWKPKSKFIKIAKIAYVCSPTPCH
jgi:hypothetical protein